MKITAKIKIKRDHKCINCGKISDNGDTITIDIPVCYSVNEIEQYMNNYLRTIPRTDFPVGWSSFPEGLYCDGCK